MPSKASKFAADQKKKQQRQKLFVIVGGVLLVVVFAYEAMTLGLIGGKKTLPPPIDTGPSTTVASTTPNALTPPALPGTATPAPSTAAPSSGLADTDVAPTTAGDGQLVSFGVFESKNPFVPQVHDSTSGAAGSASVVPASGGSSGTGSSTGTPTGKSGADVPPAGATVTPSTTGTTPTNTSTTTTATVPAEVVSISVNGNVSKVGKDGTFPSGSPVFRLVSFAKGTAEIGIVGGSYQSGGATLTLEQGKAVTLMNTSDNKRYKLVLLSTP
jgi:hypothetical protein